MPLEPVLPADPRACFLAHRTEIEAALSQVLEAGRYVLGPSVAAFEEEFAASVGAAAAVGVASGTDALVLALWACGIGRGDSVFTVSHTAVATVAAIELAGAAPVLVDIDSRTYTLDPQRLEAAVRGHRGTGRRAVIPVHLYGQPADLPAILDVARRCELIVIEDCAQAHGAAFAGRQVGTHGAAGAFSFYPTKNLGALGDGGAVVSTDAALAERVRELREYGWRERYVSEQRGTNSRLDEMQAAILRVKLRHLDADNGCRRQIAAAYGDGLRDSGLSLPAVRPAAMHAWHQYVVRCARRDALREALARQGIGTLIHYPLAVHQQPAYRGRLAHDPSGLGETETVVREVLSLPMHAHLEQSAVRRVVEATGATMRGGLD